jgi:hypothetical protein
MKDGRTHLAHKAEHAVDLETGAIVGITVQDTNEGDTTTSIETLIEAAEQVEAVRPDGQGIEDVVGDKGYHSNQSLVDLEAVGIRSYIAEPGSWAAELEGEPNRPRRRVPQSSAHPRPTRTAAAAPARRALGTPLRPSL